MTIFERRQPWGSRCLLIVGTLALITANTIPAIAQDGRPDLRLSLDIGKSEVVVGEPIYATLILTNSGNSPIPVFPDLYPEVEVGAIEIRRDGTIKRFRPTAVDDVETQVRTLAPGRSVSATFPIFFGANGWVFTTSGSYEITGLYTHPTAGRSGQLRSPAAVLRVVDGGPAGALLTDGNTGGREAGLFMHWMGGDHLRRGIASLETVIEKYPDTIQAQYARLSLGLSLSRGFRDYSIGKVRPPDFARARTLFAPIGDTGLQPVAALHKALAEARVAFGLGDSAQARASAERARAIVRQRPALSDLIDQTIRVTPGLEPFFKR